MRAGGTKATRRSRSWRGDRSPSRPTRGPRCPGDRPRRSGRGESQDGVGRPDRAAWPSGAAVDTWARRPDAMAWQVRVGAGRVAWPESPWSTVPRRTGRRHKPIGPRRTCVGRWRIPHPTPHPRDRDAPEALPHVTKRRIARFWPAPVRLPPPPLRPSELPSSGGFFLPPVSRLRGGRRTRRDSRSEDRARGCADGAHPSPWDPPADRRGNGAAAPAAVAVLPPPPLFRMETVVNRARLRGRRRRVARHRGCRGSGRLSR